MHSCSDVLETSRVPCYSLIDRMESATFRKIRSALEETTEWS